MSTARIPVEPTQATARPLLTIHIDLGQLIAVVRRHAPLTTMAARAIHDDFARLFDAPRIVAVSSTSTRTRKTKAAIDQAPNRASKGTP